MKNVTSTPKCERPEQADPAAEVLRYEAPRITRKRSLERVTLGTGTVTPGGGVGGN